ncbi:MAG TPA: hypothetical protein VGL38_03785 [bacterium]|jgi:hypothetical protein
MTWNIGTVCRVIARLIRGTVRVAFRRRSTWPDSSAATTLFI